MPAGLTERGRSERVWPFFAMALGLTWLLDLPWVLAARQGQPPPPTALLLTGLGALGPTVAAFVLAARERALGAVFGRWRTNPLWVAVALLTPAALHLAANLLETALGGQVAQWFYPPARPEHLVALVMFSIGEEFGWRGYAYPRLAERRGPVVSALVVGAVWAVWHLGMMFTPEAGAPSLSLVGLRVVELSLYSVVFAWVFERGGRSMAVAIAFHAGGHLDNVHRAPEGEVRLWALRILVLTVAAVAAARSLSARSALAKPLPESPPAPSPRQ